MREECRDGQIVLQEDLHEDNEKGEAEEGEKDLRNSDHFIEFQEEREASCKNTIEANVEEDREDIAGDGLEDFRRGLSRRNTQLYLHPKRCHKQTQSFHRN